MANPPELTVVFSLDEDSNIFVKSFAFSDGNRHKHIIEEQHRDAALREHLFLAYLCVFVLCKAHLGKLKVEGVHTKSWPGNTVKDNHRKESNWRVRVFGSDWQKLLNLQRGRLYLGDTFLAYEDLCFFRDGKPLTQPEELEFLADQLATVCGQTIIREQATNAIRPKPPDADSQFDVVIPVGPMDSDKERMARTVPVAGVKLLASVDGSPVFFHILRSLMPVRDRLGTIYVLMTEIANGPAHKELEKLRKAAAHSAEFQGLNIQLVSGKGEQGETPLDTLCSRLDSLTSHIIVHYSDVWPEPDAEFYPRLLKAASRDTGSVERAEFGGLLGCSTQPPQVFLSAILGHPEAHLTFANLVQYPFHVVHLKAERRVKKTFETHEYRVANMAIAVLTKEFLRHVKSSTSRISGNRFVKQELFRTIAEVSQEDHQVSEKPFYFKVSVFNGKWWHCDTDFDVAEINGRPRETTSKELGVST